LIEITKISNGLRIVTEEIPYLRSASVGVWVLAGSRHEADRDSGIAHFTEHMLFKGTEKRTAADIAYEMDSIGGQINAYTAKELTCYYARVLDDHLLTALDILSDMFFNSLFDEDEIEKEKNVILEEISMCEDTPEDLCHEILHQTIWPNTGLGRNILGTEETVLSFKRADFDDFIKRNYRAENVVVSVAGKFDKSTVLAEVERLFSVFGGGDAKPREDEAASYTPGIVSRNKDIEQLHICMAFPGVPLGRDEMYAATAMNTMFGGGMSSRLFQNIREKHGLVYSIYSTPICYRDSGIFIICAALNPSSVGKAYELINSEINGFFSNPVTEEILKNTKEQLKSNLVLGLESTSSRMSANARAELLMGRIITPNEQLEKIEAISLDNIYNLAKMIFDAEKRSIAAVGRDCGFLNSVM